MGASNSSSASSETKAATSAENPHVAYASSTMANRPVLATEQRMVSLSSGATVLGPITSTNVPTLSGLAAASIGRDSITLTATKVTSPPERPIADSPNEI